MPNDPYSSDNRCTTQPARPVDLRAPGAIAQLLDWRRSRHGDLRMEAGESGDGGGGTGSGGTGGAGGTGAGGNGSGSTYTPPADLAALDAIIEGRLARERQRYADYNDLKTKAAAYDKHQADNASELDKAKNEAKAEGVKEATEAAHNVLRSAEARVQLGQAKARNVGTTVRLLDLSAVKVDDAGVVDEKAVKAAVDALKASDPYLFDDGGSGRSENEPAGGGTGSGAGSASDAGIGAGGSNGGGAGAVFGKSRLAAVKRASTTRAGQQS